MKYAKLNIHFKFFKNYCNGYLFSYIYWHYYFYEHSCSIEFYMNFALFMRHVINKEQKRICRWPIKYLGLRSLWPVRFFALFYVTHEPEMPSRFQLKQK